MAKPASEEERLLEFLYAAPVGLVEIDAGGDIVMINPHAMKHLLPIAGTRDAGNLFAILEGCAPELRNAFDAFRPARGMVCDGHRIVVDLSRPAGGEPKVLACSLVKLDDDRAMAAISDISDQVAKERRLKQAETWFSSLLDDVNDYAVLSIDAAGKVEAVNPSWEQQTGFPGGPLIGAPLAQVMPAPVGNGDPALQEQLRRAARDGWHLHESWHTRRDGSLYWCQSLLAARTGVTGELTGYTVVLRDVARQHHATDDLRRLLTQDHLTGAANRAHFQQMLERETRSCALQDVPLSLVMIDIDHFKQVNDRYGHPAGDLVLTAFAQAIMPMLRPMDVLARLGGEEFAVLLPATGLEAAVELAERLRRRIAELRIETPKGTVQITISLGCATAGADGDLLGIADDALYAAKRAGRDRVRCHRRGVMAA